MTWRMPPLALIERPTWTRGRTTTMYLMYCYLFVARWPCCWSRRSSSAEPAWPDVHGGGTFSAWT